MSKEQGSENIAMDALFGVDHSSLMAMSSVSSDLLEVVKASWENDSAMQELIQKIVNVVTSSKYTFNGQLLKKKGRLVV